MTIAIDTSAGRNVKITERFHFKCFNLIAAEHPTHHFIFIFDTHPDPELYLEPNCTPVIVSPAMKNSLLRHYWYNYKIPSLLKRYHADIFVTAGSTCSLRTTVPQCMIIESFTLSDKKTGSYWKKFMPSFLQTARSVCITNPMITDELINKFRAQPEKITLTHPGIDIEEPLSESEKDEIKLSYSAGREFFFYDGNTAGMKHIITLLKAFSIFKKWQRSDMQLLLMMKAQPDAELSKQLSLYKYIKDVHLISRDKVSQVLPAAYAAVILDDRSYPSTALMAARAGVPLILNESSLFRKFFDDAAIYISLTENDIAGRMMMLYKDEHERNLQIKKGINITNTYSWHYAATAIWKVLILNANK